MAINDRLAELKSKFDENPRRYFAPLANEYRKQGDLTQAVAICRTHLPNQPGHVSGHIVLGQALYEARELGESRQTFEAALDLDPENLIALRYLGDIAREQGATPSARAWYQRVLDADPRNVEIVGLLQGLDSAPSPAFTEAPTPTSSAVIDEPPDFTVHSHPWQEELADGAAQSDSVDSFAASFEAPASWTPDADQAVTDEADAESDPFASPPFGTAEVERADVPASEPETEVEDWFALADMTSPSQPAPIEAAVPEVGFPDFGTPSGETPSEPTESAWDELQAASEPDFSDFSLPSANVPQPDEETPLPIGREFEVTLESAEQDVDELDVEAFSGSLQADVEAELSSEAGDVGESIAEDLSEVDPHDAVEAEADVFESSVTGVAVPAPESEWDAAQETTLSEHPLHAYEEAASSTKPEEIDLSGWDSFNLDEPVTTANAADLEAAVAEVDPVLGRTPDLEASPDDSNEASTPTPFVTETMAELYLQQGFADEALTVYRQLLAASPNDTNLRERVEALEKGGDSNVGGTSSSLGDSARDFFARFARLKGRHQSGNAGEVSPPRMATPSYGTAGLASASEALTQPDVGESALDTLFSSGASTAAAADVSSASHLLSAFTQRDNPGAERADLSLASLFGNVPVDSPGAVTLGGISGATDASDATQAASVLESESPQGDIEQFTAWLEGLKKK